MKAYLSPQKPSVSKLGIMATKQIYMKYTHIRVDRQTGILGKIPVDWPIFKVIWCKFDLFVHMETRMPENKKETKMG